MDRLSLPGVRTESADSLGHNTKVFHATTNTTEASSLRRSTGCLGLLLFWPRHSSGGVAARKEQTAMNTSVTAEIKDGKLIITLPVNQQPVTSSTGKSKIVASTGGFASTTVVVNGQQVKVNVTAIIK